MEWAKRTEWEANNDTIGNPADNVQHGVVRSDLRPIFGLHTPALLEGIVNFVNDIGCIVSKHLSQLFPDDVPMHGIGDNLRMQHGVVGLQKAAVDFILTKYSLFMLQQPLHL